MAFGDKRTINRANPYKSIALFIDGANFFVSAKTVGLDIDWKRFLSYYKSQGDFIRAYYYTGVLPKSDQHDPMRKTLDWISYNGFQLRTKLAKEFIDPITGVRKVKGNCDIEICIDAWNMCPHITDMFLFSGDGDFVPLVERIQQEGVRVHVVSTIDPGAKPQERNSICADLLRRQCDYYHELAELVEEFRRVD